MKLAIKNNSSNVKYMCLTSPLGKAKRYYLPDKGKQPPPLYGVLRVSCNTGDIISQISVFVNNKIKFSVYYTAYIDFFLQL